MLAMQLLQEAGPPQDSSQRLSHALGTFERAAAQVIRRLWGLPSPLLSTAACFTARFGAEARCLHVLRLPLLSHLKAQYLLLSALIWLQLGLGSV